MEDLWVNLARARRSKTFDEIIGQELALRLVKNSLYKQQLFPVYLLAGQRGCGKTTLGRVFAAAINCERRPDFIQRPRETNIPCLICASCVAMQQGSHPDFYEIDAASHTGVDNVRALIEGASFLPCLGTKKIYLIDEAHMLSKAAFNAFLKVLEEPPPSVVFMLATTDLHKILDTVRSRCFQLFLDPVDAHVLQRYLVLVCQQEEIPYEEEALLSIAYESEGSVRDALNCLERLRLAYGSVSVAGVMRVLGDTPYEALISLCRSAFFSTPTELVGALSHCNLQQFSAVRTWKKVIDILRGLIGIRYGTLDRSLSPYQELLKEIALPLSLPQIMAALELWYEAEPLFIKSQAQHGLLEMLFLQMNQRCGNSEKTTAEQATKAQKSSVKAPTQRHEASPPSKNQSATSDQVVGPWQVFLKGIDKKDDPLVASIFKQAVFQGYSKPLVVLTFAQDLLFFKDLLEQSKATWKHLLEEVFGKGADLRLEFTGPLTPQGTPPRPAVLEKSENLQKKEVARPPVAAPRGRPASSFRAAVPTTLGKPLDIRNEQQWSKVHMVLRFFPGIAREEKEV